MRLSKEEAARIVESLNYRHEEGTVVAVVQDNHSLEVLMVASVNREALFKTLTTGLLHFWSLSRHSLWLKGETSGNYQLLVDFKVDCDADAVLFKVEPKGPACHTMNRSCFYRGYGELTADRSSKH
ncbi:phosphoribosyl-AMP cyclohydrolase [Sulfodiicoccus acidiphilus]|uniref:Phosphoribosyl-AMP cyclohydrolase n=1 Tax=Sulfodiicoccus acidiphilus TaxID=1670455 RepID=A0A348B725_9CREN|nr:phosphoribosyl-AMP cyclohydrolase [Sulfodiicoccus acidiphilus]BBD73977.1 phosphoribosyl-AMP cyclohydrolase [Sulfodiicoccus acidiphilus]GGU02688.1 phosphoribosyl-AMP cyclohydrolase [Sulfodiicoccus acidiphilus]